MGFGAYRERHCSTYVSLTQMLSLMCMLPSYLSLPFYNQPKEKKRKYLNICEQNHLSFTPLVIFVDRTFAPKTNSFLKTLTEKLAYCWDCPNSWVAGWLRAQTAVALMQASGMCIQGTWNKWWSNKNLINFKDGAGVKILILMTVKIKKIWCQNFYNYYFYGILTIEIKIF